MSQNLSVDEEYRNWVVGLKGRIRTTQIKAAMAVNRELLEMYWELGKEIWEKQQTMKWGEGLIDQLSKDLHAAFPEVKGFSRRNLMYVRQWYLFYKDSVKVPQVVAQLVGSGKVQQVVGQIKEDTHKSEPELAAQLVRLIPWGHNRLIINKCSDVVEALFYVRETIQNNWSRAVLQGQLESNLYNRQGKAIHNFEKTLPLPQADLAKETLKNPYNFDFLTLGKDAHERDLERTLTGHIQKFLLELGQGFAYMGRQFPINVGGDDFYLDLLFYHTRLRCYVVVELKATEFKPEYAGKLNFYLNVVNAQLKHSQDQPSVGILLCKTPNKVLVEYGLENIASPLGVSEYQIMNAVPESLKGELPSIEELELEFSRIPAPVEK